MAVFGIVLALLGTLFGGMMAGDRCYQLDHFQFERTHHRNPNYMTLLQKYEITGATIGALPGAVIVLVELINRRRKLPIAL